MKFVVRPSALRGGSVRVPGDKSISHRALMFGAIAAGRTTIDGFLAGEDCLATLAALQAMGVRIERNGATQVVVNGVGLHGLRAPQGELDLGNSGTGMRLFSGLLAGQAFDTVLTGDASLSARPMARVIKPLSEMGAQIGSHAGKPPLRIKGGCALHGIDYALPVASAQVKSAILLAGLYAAHETCVREPAVTRDHTERMLATMGADIASRDGVIRLRPGNPLTATHIDVPADLSSATFPLLAALLANDCELVLEGVGINPTRDGVLRILQLMGADIELHNARQSGAEPVADLVVRSSALRGITVDPELVPLAIDEFPALFIAAACAEGTTEFRGLAELRVKESDRIAAMAKGLTALGIDVEELPDGARIRGGRLRSGSVNSDGDHRIAMAFAVAATVADGPVTIDDVASVATSFPDFEATMRPLGFDIMSDRGGTVTARPDHVPVLAIDGPSGSGKGTIARRVATELGWHLLDSGALYRLVALAANRDGVALDDEPRLAALAARLPVRFAVAADGGEEIWLGDAEVSDALRTEECGSWASAVAVLPAVRTGLLELQRNFRKAPGLVADGRDMGTQVFPDATLKVFLTASAEERAQRRHKQLKDKGLDVSLAALSRDIEDRDRRDSERSVAPLRPAADARILDSSDLTIDEVCDTILVWVRECLSETEQHSQ